MFAPPHCHEPLSVVVPVSVALPLASMTRPAPVIWPPSRHSELLLISRVPAVAFTVPRLRMVMLEVLVVFVPPVLVSRPRLWNVPPSPEQQWSRARPSAASRHSPAL